MSETIKIHVSDIPEAEAYLVPGDENSTGEDISVFHAEDGSFYALNDECTHEVASLAEGWIEGTEVECPMHAARFCLKSGKALCLPATVDAKTHKVEVEGDTVVLYPGVPAADTE